MSSHAAVPVPSPRLARALLMTLAVAPALAVLPGRWGDHIAFVLYREPKWAVLSVLGWAFLAAWAWDHRRIAPPRLGSALRTVPAASLAGLLIWMGLSRFWGRVPENHTLELRGWLLGALVAAACLAGHRTADDGRWRWTLRWALVSAGAAVTLIGLLQLVVPIPGLIPIDADRYGVVQTSTLGYKNPAAWAVVGQIFVAGGLALAVRRRGLRWALWGLVAAQIFYIGGLQSRTAIVAFLAGLTVWLGLDPGVARRRGAVGAVAALGVLALALGLSPAARERALTLLDLAKPAAYLESDRGVYLRNTLAMVAERPLGVGLGDWQTEYPVYRAVGREVAFDGLHQVRRAHADHVQMLGELGWPGLVLWLLLLASVAVTGARAARRGSRPAAAATAQWCALAVAMAGDYVVEMPYARLQWFLVLAWVLVEASPPGAREPRPSRRGAARDGGRGLVAAAALLLPVVLLEGLGAVATVRGALHEAKVEVSYRTAMASEDPALRADLFWESISWCDSMDSMPFHSKTRYRAELLAAHAAQQLGRPAESCRFLKRSLRLYPYQKPGLQLAARLSEGEKREAFDRAARHVDHGAGHGFVGTYPDLSCR
ncbi:MAG: O-antigen ligase family protein [Acidobacteriota bacterium]